MMRCNCENRLCQLREAGRCDQLALVRCVWIGGVCLACAESLKNYLIPVGMDDRPTVVDWARFKFDTANYLRQESTVMDTPGDQERDREEERYNERLLREE